MDQNEQRLRALEQLQRADEPLLAYDKGVLQAIRRASPTLADRCDAVARIEQGRCRKRAGARKPVLARRDPSVFDPPADDDDKVLP